MHTDEYKRYKALAEAAIAQVGDEELGHPGQAGGNPIEMLIRAVAGNLKSRFTDFRMSDGEKPWRHRDDEFESALGAAELMQLWDSWDVLLGELEKLSDADLSATVTVRRQPLRIDEALHRSLAHAAYHVGQIVFMAKGDARRAGGGLSVFRRGTRRRLTMKAPRNGRPRTGDAQEAPLKGALRNGRRAPA